MKKNMMILLSVLMLVLSACGIDRDTIENENMEEIEEKAEEYNANIEVEFHETNDGNEHIVIAGKTNLPDGEEVIASVVSEENDYIANDTDEVENGLYVVGPFSKEGESLPVGEYTIKITSKVGDKLEEERSITID